MKSAFVVAFFVLLPMLPGNADDTFPFWVKTTQAFQYAGTEWIASIGNPEQVIGEEGVNYIIMAPDGAQLKLPRAYTQKITGDEASILLLSERKLLKEAYDKYGAQYNQVVAEAKKRIEEYDTALKQAQAKVAEYEQGIQLITAYMKMQQQQQSGRQPSTLEIREQLQLMQQIQDLAKPQDKRRIPSQNRYEINVNE